MANRPLLPVLAALLALSACPGRGGPPSEAPSQPAGPTLSEDLQQLVIPVAQGTAEALQRLEKRADEGQLAAAWGRAHYLIDLFDDARFRRDDDSLRVLIATMGDASLSPAARGAEATSKVLAFLSAEVNRVIRSDRLHAGAQAALVLLAFDGRPPLRRVEVLQRIGELKAITTDSELASNALLRMYGYCRTAFDDATRARWADRMQMLCHCLYPLYRSDPEPYFAKDPARRPPPPRWRDLAEGMDALLERIAEHHDRLAPAADYQRNDLAEFLAANAEQFPALPDPAKIDAPPVDWAIPYDWTPLLRLGAGEKLDSVDHYAEALAMPLQGDGRATVALALARSAPASALAQAIAIAKRAGATRLELLVTVKQRLDVPPGDYWHGRLQGQEAIRLAAIPVAVEPAAPAPGQAPSAAAEQPVWDPARASLGLHLAIGASRWDLVAPKGRIATIDTSAAGSNPSAELRNVLARIRGAFSDEIGLVLVPLAETHHGAVIAAASAAAHDAEGRPLFPMLAFSDQAPEPRPGKALRARIDRRWQAEVEVDPPALQSRTAVIRSCYQDLLEKQPRLGGEIRLEVGPKGPVVAKGPANRRLRACALRGAGAVMTEKGIASARVTLRPHPPAGAPK